MDYSKGDFHSEYVYKHSGVPLVSSLEKLHYQFTLWTGLYMLNKTERLAIQALIVMATVFVVRGVSVLMSQFLV